MTDEEAAEWCVRLANAFMARMRQEFGGEETQIVARALQCATITRMLGAFLDEALAPEEIARMAHHVADYAVAFAECQAEDRRQVAEGPSIPNPPTGQSVM